MLSLTVTVDRVFGSRYPTAAAPWGSGAAVTRAARANRLAQPGASPARLARAETLALAALAREPGHVPAIRALGTAAGLRGDVPRADRWFGYAERLSRRDFLTQVWLIEERVRQGDVNGALLHYDRALRTVGRARPVLFPVLVSAVADPEVERATGRLLAQRVAWGPDFLAVMAEAANVSPDALGQLALAARLRPDVPGERGPLDAVLARLVATGRYAVAQAVWRQATGERGPLPTVRDGGFEAAGGLAPFGWTLNNAGDLSATREPNGSGTALVLRTARGAAGELARQLVLLAPGEYRLSLTATGAASDRFSQAVVSVTCLGEATGGERLRLPIAATTRQRLAGSFSIPGDCPAQSLAILAPSGLGDGGEGVAIDDLALESRSRDRG